MHFGHAAAVAGVRGSYYALSDRHRHATCNAGARLAGLGSILRFAVAASSIASLSAIAREPLQRQPRERALLHSNQRA